MPGWTCKHQDLNRLCPKISPITASTSTYFVEKIELVSGLWQPQILLDHQLTTSGDRTLFFYQYACMDERWKLRFEKRLIGLQQHETCALV